jgi:hypothetical protein
MENLSSYYTIIEECIQRLGIDPVQCRGEKEGQWSLTKGSAKVWLDLWHIEREGRAYLQVMSPFMEVPASNREVFFEDLLKTNDQMFGVAFSVYDGWSWLKVIREVDGLDSDEAFAMLTRVGNYADKYDDEFLEKYGKDLAGGAAPDIH